MSLLQSQWQTERAKLVSARDSINSAMLAIDAVYTGWEVAAYPRRSWMGSVVHNGKLHILGGWNCVSSGGALFADSWRASADLLTAERAIVSGLSSRCYFDVVSYNGEILVGPGYDGTLPPASPDDQVTNVVLGSADGTNFVSKASPNGPRETGGFLVHEGYVYCFLGLKYTWNPYALSMYRDAQRFDGTSWTQRSADLGFNRRSFGYESWGGAIVIVAGRDDAAGVDHADALRSTDGMQTMPTAANNLPFASCYGLKLKKFGGRLVLLGGKNASGTHFNQVWSTDDPMMSANSWVQHTTPAWPGRSGFGCEVLEVNGVETICVFGGHDGTSTALGDFWTATNLNGPWTRLNASAFDPG